VKYYRQSEGGKTEVLTRDEFLNGMKGEFMWGPGYYEHMMMLLGKGHKLVGSIHMYWVEWDEVQIDESDQLSDTELTSEIARIWMCNGGTADTFNKCVLNIITKIHS
jgi:hypothetical protein